ncbi:hypothetical protein [Enterovibrio sp. 27052020O]|uniref:hypothetical protein n=1 Tax=Enterovibrio sp. 27052020O TaxID=3241166 RepID=UPI00388CFC4E
MSHFKKGHDKGYKAGLTKGIELALSQFAGGIEFAGVIRKKQYTILSAEISTAKQSVLPPQVTCQFSQAWQGQCKCTDILDNGQCKAHQERCSCGSLATNSCAHAGQFVCGRPLCDDCKCKH